MKNAPHRRRLHNRIEPDPSRPQPHLGLRNAITDRRETPCVFPAPSRGSAVSKCLAVIGAVLVGIQPVSAARWFHAMPPVAVGSFPFAIAAGDLNNDGNVDLVVADSQDSAVSILLGNGDGTFRDAIVASAGPLPVRLALADLNGDGNLDIVIANDDEPALPKYVSVLIGMGDGTFAEPVPHTVDLYPMAIAIADFNEDGIADIAVATNNESISLLIGRGDGDFEDQRIYDVGQTIESIAAAPLSDSGHLDLVMTSNGFNEAVVVLGDGTGAFGAPTTYGVNLQPLDVAVADFDGDGRADIITVSQGSRVDVLFGDGHGGIRERRSLTAGSISQAVAVADFDADGYADAVVANSLSNTVGVYWGRPDGDLLGPEMLHVGDYPNDVATADFNNDGLPDIVVLDRNDFAATVLLNVPDALFGDGFDAPPSLKANSPAARK